MRYLKGTINLRLEYGRDSRHSCIGFSDSDWGGNSENRRSTTGYVFILQHQFCSTDNMTADILTKPLTREKHFKLTGLLGMKNVQVS